MVAEHIDIILYVTGGITAIMLLQFISPRFALKQFNQIELSSEAALIFARHWALMVAIGGGLLIYAGAHAELRVPVMLAISCSKLSYIIILLIKFQDFGKKMMDGLVFDSICVALYAIYLVGATSGAAS